MDEAVACVLEPEVLGVGAVGRVLPDEVTDVASLAPWTSRHIFDAAYTSVYGMNGRNWSGVDAMFQHLGQVVRRGVAGTEVGVVVAQEPPGDRLQDRCVVEVQSSSEPNTAPALIQGETTNDGTRTPVVCSIPGATGTAFGGGTWSKKPPCSS